MAMLIRFSVENFRSIRERQELSLVAARIKDLPEATFQAESLGLRLLRVVAVYGANASGKTNVVRALAYMVGAIKNSQRRWSPTGEIPVDPFLLDEVSAGNPSGFEVDALIDGIRYTYGFRLDRTRVLAEWLRAYPRGKKQTWFKRDTASPTEFRFGKNLIGENRTIQKLTRPNSLYLSAAAQNGHQQLLPIFNWFAKRFGFVNPASRRTLQFSAVEMCNTPEGRSNVLRFLSAADLGIVDIDIGKREINEKVKNAVQVLIQTLTDSEEVVDPAEIPDIHLRHQTAKGGARVPLDFDEESEGTKALFSLTAPVFQTLSKGGVLCVDELDSSLHPILALQIVKLFSSPETNPHNAQLIFNTHDTNLLDDELLRRDQIWFTEKDRTGATHLYPLSDFKPRRHENLEKGYLQGRYGAIPVPGRLFTAAVDGQ